MGILSQGVRNIPSPGYSDLLTLSQPDHSQRTFNGIFLESLKDDLSKRIHWTESDHIAHKQWLAKHNMSLAGLRQDEDLLHQLGRSVGIDFDVISTEHWDVVRRKLLASLENKLKKLKQLGLVEYYCQDEKRVKARWPDAVRDEWASPTWRGEEESLRKLMVKSRAQMDEAQMDEVTSGIETCHLTDDEPINPDKARAFNASPTPTIPDITPQEISSTRSDSSRDRPFDQLEPMDVSFPDDDPRPRSQQAAQGLQRWAEAALRERNPQLAWMIKELILHILHIQEGQEASQWTARRFEDCYEKTQKRGGQPIVPFIEQLCQALEIRLPQPEQTVQYDHEESNREESNREESGGRGIISIPSDSSETVQTQHDESLAKHQKRAAQDTPSGWLLSLIATPRHTTAKETTSALAVPHEAIVSRPKPSPRAVPTSSRPPPPTPLAPMMPSPLMHSPVTPSPMALSISSTKSGRHNLDYSSENKSEDTAKLPPLTYRSPTRRLSFRNVLQHPPRTATPEAISQQDSPQSACSRTKRDQSPSLDASRWSASKSLPTPEAWRLPTPAERHPGSCFAPITSGRVESSNVLNTGTAPASSSSCPIPAVVASSAHHHLGTESQTEPFSSPVLPSVERPRQPTIACEAKPSRTESTSRNEPSPQSSDINTTQPVSPGARSISQHSLQSTPAESQTQRLAMQKVQDFEAAAEVRAMKLRLLLELGAQRRALTLKARHVVALSGEGGFHQEAFWLKQEEVKEEAKQLLDEIRREEAPYDLGSLTLTVPGGCFERLVLGGCF